MDISISLYLEAHSHIFMASHGSRLQAFITCCIKCIFLIYMQDIPRTLLLLPPLKFFAFLEKSLLLPHTCTLKQCPQSVVSPSQSRKGTPNPTSPTLSSSQHFLPFPRTDSSHSPSQLLLKHPPVLVNVRLMSTSHLT